MKANFIDNFGKKDMVMRDFKKFISIEKSRNFGHNTWFDSCGGIGGQSFLKEQKEKKGKNDLEF